MQTHAIPVNTFVFPLKWRCNGCYGVSDHQRLDCLFNRLVRRRSKKTLKLRGVTSLCGGIHRSPVKSPHKGPVTRKIFTFDEVIMCMDYWLIVAEWPYVFYWTGSTLVQVVISRMFGASHYSNTENKNSSIWQLCSHWLYRKLSEWQLTVPPVTTKLFDWRCFIFCVSQFLLIEP